MIRSRLFWEIMLPYAAFALLVAAGLVWIGGEQYARSEREGLTRRLRAAARSVAVRHGAFASPTGEWQADLARLAEAESIRLTVVSGDGTPLADTKADPSLLGPLRDEPDVRQARLSGVGSATSEDGERLTVAVAARGPSTSRPGPLLGFVRAEGSTHQAAAAIRRWRRWAAGLTGVAALLGLAAAGRTASRLARPVEAFTRSAAQAAGTGQPPPRLGGGLALAPLSAALAEMTQDLGDRFDRLRRENATLTADRERLSAVLTGMAEGVLAVDRDERVLFANPAASQLLDLPDAKLVGRPLWEAIRVPAIQEAARAALAGRETPQVELELPRTGTALALRAGCLPGEPSPGVVLVLHDVTELRRLENLRREFVSNVSHELKTPLASIQAYTETLIDGAIDDRENNVRFLKRIAEQADRLHNLILDLLRLARIEGGTDVFEIRKLSAGKLIEPCIEEHAAVAKKKGVSVQGEPPAEPVRLQADPDGFRTILDNLLDNAVNYTPAGGRVTVRWGRSNGMALIEVADTGIGIPAEHLPRIFERFHRVDKARSREHGGTGLGLAIVKHLVHVFNGRVEVESEPGHGSKFRVFLPAA